MRLAQRWLVQLVSGLLAIALVVTGWYVYTWQARLITVGDLRIDPLAPIDPARRYVIVVWLEDLHMPTVRPEQHRAATAAAIAELNEVYPNISVFVEYFGVGELSARLEEALTAGVGPDIAGLLGGSRVSPGRQVPIDPYLSAESRLDMIPTAEVAVRQGDRLWAWPRWLTFNVWVAHAPFAQEMHEAVPHADTLLTQATAWSASRNLPAIAYNGYDPHLWFDVYVASGGERLFSEDGELRIDVEAAERSATLLTQWVAEGVMSRQVANASRSRLAAFWDRRAALMMPANHLLLHHALSRTGELAHDEDGRDAHTQPAPLSLLAPVYTGDHWQGVPGHAAVYVALLRDEHAGDDHTRAVMHVGEHLSRRLGLWEAVHLLAVPAHPTSLHKWETATGMRPEMASQLIDWSSRMIAPPVDRAVAQIEAEALSQVVAPLQLALLSGELTPALFTERLESDLVALLSRYQRHSGSTL